MNDNIIKNRIKAVHSALLKHKLDCIIITKPANVTYVNGFSGDDSWSIITSKKSYLLTDSRYTEQAKKQCRCCKIIEWKNPIAREVAKLLNKQKSVQKIAIESSCSISIFKCLRKILKTRLKTISNTIESIRGTKDNSEIKSISAAANIAANAFRETVKHLKSGISENELAGILDFETRKLTATNSFETIVAFGANASQPHHHPNSRKLRKNDTALIDFGVKYKNYCCDLTRCFIVGKSTALYLKAYETVKKAHDTALKMIKDGIEIKKVDSAARKIIKDSGLPVYGHGTGHGLGLEVHEQPILSSKSKGKLCSGMVITIEPGIYIPGKLGIRLEDDLLVTQNGCETLTKSCPHTISI
ncbi:MAG: M24 family metallopeptidase [Planctomycetota bacterium]